MQKALVNFVGRDSNLEDFDWPATQAANTASEFDFVYFVDYLNKVSFSEKQGLSVRAVQTIFE